jgi:hypothetical protein
MDKREFLKTLLAGGAGLFLSRVPVLGQQMKPYNPPPQLQKLPDPLPPVQVNPFSSEIVLNSRYSVHGGYSGALPLQVVANILWAAGKAPMTGSSRKIYAALPDNVYVYDENQHALVLHKKGNHLSESNLALEVGVSGELDEDAGACLHYAQLAALSFWTSSTNQPVCCVKDSSRSNANSTWSPGSTIHMGCCFGRASSVNGLTSQLVAVSSDGSLPDPDTDGPVLLEDAFAGIQYGTQFQSTELGLGELSQIAWGSYGNTPHTAIGRGALTVASAVAYYYMTGRIYIVRSDGVERYHIRLPSGSTSSRDHRIERVTSGDRRPSLRGATSKLPQSAPNYFVYCATGSSNWQRVEAGFCGASALLQASSLDLQGHTCADFSSQERTAIINALSIPSNDTPLLVFSAGHGR